MELMPQCMAEQASTVGETNSGPSSILLILAACGGEIFSKSTVVQTKMGHVKKTTPLLGVICHPFVKTPFVENLRALASAIPEIWMGRIGAPKI